MKYAIPFINSFRFNSEADEFIIKYKDNPTKLIDFLKLYKDKKITLRVDDYTMTQKDLEQLSNFLSIISKEKEAYKNLHISMRTLKGYSYIKNNYPFDVSLDLICRNWEDFNIFLALNPKEIKIGGDLCYNLKQAAKKAKENGIELKICPNVAMESPFTTEAKIYADISEVPLRKFFIRPEDQEVVEGLIDTFELCSWDIKEGEPEPYINKAWLYMLCLAYIREKTWKGDVKDFFSGLEKEDFSNANIPTVLLQQKIECGQKCLKNTSNKGCAICNNIEELCTSLKDKLVTKDYSNLLRYEESKS